MTKPLSQNMRDSLRRAHEAHRAKLRARKFLSIQTMPEEISPEKFEESVREAAQLLPGEKGAFFRQILVELEMRRRSALYAAESRDFLRSLAKARGISPVPGLKVDLVRAHLAWSPA
jgi:hypothetical protein